MKIETFIFVHDQNIILDYIKHNKFNNFEKVKYVFLGGGDISKIQNLPSVIISRDLQHNIEHYPKLTSFTGWYSIWKNKLYDADYLNLFEYDINLSQNFNDVQNIYLNSNEIIGYIPLNVHDGAFIKVRGWSDKIIEAINFRYHINVDNYIDNLPKNTVCTVTSNHTFSVKTFESYMEWMEPMIDTVAQSPLSGHQTERSIPLYYLINNVKYCLVSDILTHFQFDSHKTQGISEEKFIQNYNKLL